jgi:GxxExxY protein
MSENELSHKIIGACIEIHKTIGPGLLESAYETALEYELKQLGLKVLRQASLPYTYKGILMDNVYKADIIVNNKVLIELKSVLEIAPVFFAQTLTYLKASHLKLGLLINFNNVTLADGVHRIVNNLED